MTSDAEQVKLGCFSYGKMLNLNNIFPFWIHGTWRDEAMNDKLYEMMDWARIEGLVYSEEDNPHELLGAHVTKDGILIQTFMPSAVRVEVLDQRRNQTVLMDEEDENGFFAALLPGKTIPLYKLRVTFDNGSVKEIQDPYRFEPQIPVKILEQWEAGVCKDIWRYLGAHPLTVDGIEGIHFAVWAPEAMRVSLVGDFNNWDGRHLPMKRHPRFGVFELFIPGLKTGSLYKYEIKAKNGLTFLKADPFSVRNEVRPGTASIVTDDKEFDWEDGEWMQKRALRDTAKESMTICQIHLAAFPKPDDGREFYNYRELAPMIASYAKETGYSHVQLMPVMEYLHDECRGYQTLGFYAPTSRYGTNEDLAWMINELHKEGIGVILEWAPAHFASDVSGLIGFDGTNLFEHHDPRQGINPRLGTRIFNYGRPQVSNFLIANALYWCGHFHADGLMLDRVSAMLYLDYDRQDGGWVANIYGGNENLEAVDFLKNLSRTLHGDCPGTLLFASENSTWPKVTGDPADGGLGFDYKWNSGFGSDLLSYMQLDPLFRGGSHGELIYSMVYHYSEKFILTLTASDTDASSGALYSRMPGKADNKLANIRAMLGYMTVHPGKKLFLKDIELADDRPWEITPAEKMAGRPTMKTYMKDLLGLYNTSPALWEEDYQGTGFEWINNISANENILVFLRKTADPEDMLLVVCNFSALTYEHYKIGVPFRGTYKEIFNSDAAIYGGTGAVNSRAKTSKASECDMRSDSIEITVPPLGVCVFRCKKSASQAAPKKSAKPRTSGKKKNTKSADAGAKVSVREQIEKKIETEERHF